MKLRIEIDGNSHLLDVRGDGVNVEYALDDKAPGLASIEEVMPGVYSILLGTSSLIATVAADNGELEVAVDGGEARLFSVADARDHKGQTDSNSARGPAAVRAQMPGKIVTILVSINAQVEAGQGLLVVEAMKMQNEVKAPKSGRVVKILAVEGATVAAGETLIVVE